MHALFTIVAVASIMLGVISTGIVIACIISVIKERREKKSQKNKEQLIEEMLNSTDYQFEKKFYCLLLCLEAKGVLSQKDYYKTLHSPQFDQMMAEIVYLATQED